MTDLLKKQRNSTQSAAEIPQYAVDLRCEILCLCLKLLSFL